MDFVDDEDERREIEKAGEATLDASSPAPAKDRLTGRLASGLAQRLVLKGTGPLPLLEDDPLVELLGKATNEELAPLAELLCTRGGVLILLEPSSNGDGTSQPLSISRTARIRRNAGSFMASAPG